MSETERRMYLWPGLAMIPGLIATYALLGAIPSTVAIAALAVGMIVARTASSRATAASVMELKAAIDAVAASRDAAIPPSVTSGPLAPAVEGVVRLRDALASAIEAAAVDRLTRVANRSTLLASLFEEVDRSARYGRPLSVAFIDIDHFKAVNDTYGHEAGDVVLRHVAGLLSDNVRAADVVGRYGGEEFVIILPETTVDEATAVAEKLRLLIAREQVSVADGTQLGVTVSIGLAGGHGQPLRVEDLLRDADAAMYAAKSLGRNQTYVFAESDDDSARIPRAPISQEGRAAAAEVGDLGRRAAEAALASVIMPLPHYGGQPSALIATIAVALARRLELPGGEVERIRVAALLHDIGKVGIPDEVLEKPGPLTADEWQVVVQHPRIGQEILNRVAAVKDAAAIILHHHERFSGHGYPHGLRGPDIPLGARIVAIADAYEAMLSDRPYQTAVDHQAAVAELRREAGAQFDPGLVELFCEMFAHVPPKADMRILLTAVADRPGPRRHRTPPDAAERAASA